MANVDRKRGFRPAKSLIGAPWTALVRSYPAVSGRSGTNNSGDIYIGDSVELDGNGNVIPHVTAGNNVLGVVVGVGKDNSDTALNTDKAKRYYDPDNLSKRYLAHDEEGYVGVVPAEACLFIVQAGAETLNIGDSRDIATVSTTARGSRTTGNSTQSLGTTSAAPDAKVVEMVDAPDNDPTDAGGLADYIVKFVNHENAIN